MGKYFKIAMFITSFTPLWITIMFINILSIIKGGPNLCTEKIGLAVIVISMFFSICIIYGSMKSIKETAYKPYKIVNATQEKGITSEYLLSYILPLFAFDFTKWDSVVQFLIYFSILAFLCIRNNNVYANLMFECRRYKFYTCELQWAPEPDVAPIQAVVISRLNLCANKGNTIEVEQLNKPFYLKRDSME
ncbi:hypothetical protein [Clostridium omnivorum]|uniref:Uncharacterized protein n=1 Tax=Clostridium omnivorum TaxID=1604902 RepID=A0ABQ5N7C6_9CLOT|nr:hypothetical protein [Clostridium sp. E14]GLC31133.1 hypothetical protein bsdE14_25430 [Clostridium sp. E14]